MDSTDNTLWFYGGQTPISSGSNYLWRYDISTNEWTWMKGDTISYVAPYYVTEKIADPLNTPGGRCTYCRWTDNNGDFWLFGGWDFITMARYHDTWKYERATNSWACMNMRTLALSGFANGNCSEDSMNIPERLYENKNSWKDNCGNLWMLDSYYHLWELTPATADWNLTRGTATVVEQYSYGIQGIPHPLNNPRFTYGVESWTDKDGNFWYLQIYPSMLWKFEPDLNCSGCNMAIPVASFSSDSTAICPGSCTSFNNLSLNGLSFQWTFPGGSPSTSTAIIPQNICYANSGTYDVQLIATNSTGSDTLVLSNYITVLPAPPPQGIIQTGDTLFANAGGFSYQWYYNGNLISGATAYFYVATQNGDYNVLVADSNGCETEAVIFNVLTTIESISKQDHPLIYPNPAGDKLFMEVLSAGYSAVDIYTMQGVKRITRQLNNRPVDPSTMIDISVLSKGIYLIVLTSPDKIFREVFIKE